MESIGENCAFLTDYISGMTIFRLFEWFLYVDICCHILQNSITMVEYMWVLPKRVAVRLLPK